LNADKVSDVFLDFNGGKTLATTCPFEWTKQGQDELRSSLFVDKEVNINQESNDNSFWASQCLDYFFLVNPLNNSKS